MLIVKAFSVGAPRGLSELSHEQVPEEEREFIYYYCIQAKSDERQRLTKTYDILDGDHWCGYLSLANAHLILEKTETQLVQAHLELAWPPPAVLLGKLYVCKGFRGRHIGQWAVRTAIDICLASKTACRLLILDLFRRDRANFYKKMGFLPARAKKSQMYFDLHAFEKCMRAMKKIKRNVSFEDQFEFFHQTQEAEMRKPIQMCIEDHLCS